MTALTAWLKRLCDTWRQCSCLFSDLFSVVVVPLSCLKVAETMTSNLLKGGIV